MKRRAQSEMQLGDVGVAVPLIGGIAENPGCAPLVCRWHFTEEEPAAKTMAVYSLKLFRIWREDKKGIKGGFTRVQTSTEWRMFGFRSWVATVSIQPQKQTSPTRKVAGDDLFMNFLYIWCKLSGPISKAANVLGTQV